MFKSFPLPCSSLGKGFDNSFRGGLDCSDCVFFVLGVHFGSTRVLAVRDHMGSTEQAGAYQVTVSAHLVAIVLFVSEASDRY